MKALSVFFTICCFIFPVSLFAQNQQTIEADLLKSFKKIAYWDQKQRDGKIEAGDSPGEANDMFGKKLKNYTERFPATINTQFNSLKKERLDIFTSTDGLFRIYSWETWQGGTMRDFANVMQYKNGQQTNSVLLTSSEDNYVPYYSNLYTLKTGDKIYYLGIYGGIYSTKECGTGIQVFAIKNGKLNNDVKLIKTKSGLHSKLYYEYDFLSVVDIKFELRPTITFDALTQTIRLPLVDKDRKITRDYITYKFTGKYFEKIKSK